MDDGDRHGFAVVAWIVLLVALADGLSAALGLKYMQEVEWPTDLYLLQHLDRRAPIDVGIVGSSRAHYALSPSALDACLGRALGRATETVSATRLTASLYAEDRVARDVFAGAHTPRVLLVEVAPESFNKNHFELDYNVASTADPSDTPNCVAAAIGGPATLSACARPWVRGVENLAFLFHRPWTDHAHLTWMMRYHGGGQYCFDDPECLARNRVYDEAHAGRWANRVHRVLPTVRAQRFRDYAFEDGLATEAYVALLERARRADVRLFAVNLPVSRVYQDEIPREAYAVWLAWIRPLTEAHDATLIDLNVQSWRDRRELFLDPDHLGAEGALAAAQALCDGPLPDALR